MSGDDLGAVQFSDHTTRVTVRITASVSGAPDRSKPYSRRSTEYRPDFIDVTYGSKPEGGWAREALTIGGPDVRKDGTLAQTRTSERLWLNGDAPTWALDFVRAHMPTGGAS